MSDFHQYFILESWSDNRMLQPSTIVTVKCHEDKEEIVEEEENDQPLDGSAWQLPLVLASLRVFKDVTENKTKPSSDTVTNDGENNDSKENIIDLSSSCSWTAWSEWSECSLTCGGRGRVVRRRSQTGTEMKTGV